MAKFLNTALLSEWIPKLVNETERELVIIVPYIKTSEKMYNCLYEANKRGVETTLVYRENKLTDSEKAKFQSLDNLNLMHHPNVHTKCYFNEKYLIITSMNLYEYSEINNREMGVLFHRNDLEKNFGSAADTEQVFKDAINEIRAIINSSHFEKKSRETIDLGFEMDIIKTDKEKVLEHCVKLNKVFLNKKFEPVETNNSCYPVCKDYFDKIDVTLNHRVEFTLNLPEPRLNEIYKKFIKQYNEFMIENFKLYWNHYKATIYLYPNSKSNVWNNDSETETRQHLKKGIDETIVILKKYWLRAD
jgi:hypothetical protein